MAIDENKLLDWIIEEMHSNPEGRAIDALLALSRAVPTLKEERPFADMELCQLSADMDATIDSIDEEIERFKEFLESRTAEVTAIANATLEKYPPL